MCEKWREKSKFSSLCIQFRFWFFFRIFSFFFSFAVPSPGVHNTKHKITSRGLLLLLHIVWSKIYYSEITFIGWCWERETMEAFFGTVNFHSHQDYIHWMCGGKIRNRACWKKIFLKKTKEKIIKFWTFFVCLLMKWQQNRKIVDVQASREEKRRNFPSCSRV